MVEVFYTTYISVDLVHLEIFHAKVGKGGIKRIKLHGTFGDNSSLKHHERKYMYSLPSL